MLKTLKKFYWFLFRHKKALSAFVFTLTVATILENISPYIYKLLIDAIPSQNYQLLLKIAILFVGIKIAVNFLTALSDYLGDKVLIPASKEARIAVFRRILDLDFDFHTNKNTGSLISAFKRGDSAFFALFQSLNREIFRILISLLVVLFFFIRIAPSLAFLMLLISLANTFVSWRLIKFNLKKRASFNKAEDKVSGIIADNLINYETIKLFAREEKEENRLKEKFKGWTDKLWQYANSFRLMDIIVGTLSNLAILAAFWIVIQKLVNGEISAGDLVMVSSFVTSFYYQFFSLLYRLRAIAKSYIDIQHYFSVFNTDVLIKDPDKPVKIKDIKGDIRFEKVSFSYPENKENVLTNINFHVKPGESAAFVGRSGAGKTTIIKLLLRFHDVTKGRILIDGIDIRNISQSQLRSFIGIVPQEPILFNETIGFNIAYGNDQATQEEVIKAAKMANLHQFIESLPQKYDMPVGERGVKLSGGQRQRLAIARVLLNDPKIIIFDEATSNLDPESEALIQDALWKIAKSKTVLIIAHRLSTVKQVDKILVLDNGQVVESGPHKKLIGKKQLYHHFWQLQSTGRNGQEANLLT